MLNISCIKVLFKQSEEKYNVTELETQNLSQDSLENFFSLIRMKGGNNRHPTPLSFRSSYRQVVMAQLLRSSNNANCEMDISDTLLKPEDFCKIKIRQKNNRETKGSVDTCCEMCNDSGEIFDPAKIQMCIIQLGGYYQR